MMFKNTIAITAAIFVSNLAIAAGTVYSNNDAPNGDNYTANDGSLIPLTKSAGWAYNSLRAGVTTGINGEYARNGNGSMHFNSTSSSDKADVVYFHGGANPTAPVMGYLRDLEKMSYEWLRDSASTTAAHLHTTLRVTVDFNGAAPGGYGQLIYEQVYDDSSLSSGQAVATDTWIKKTVDDNTKLWGSNSAIRAAYRNAATNAPTTEYFYNETLQDWKNVLGNAWILGFSSGSGSGWSGTYKGAVDTVSWTIAGNTTTTNFEMSEVPVPAAAWLFGTAMLGLASVKRRK